MEHATATILDGNKIVAREILAWFDVAPPGSDVPWTGGFDLKPKTHVASGKTYHLQLADGRSGPFVVTRISFHSNGGKRIECAGSAPLA